jgi:hypothetical protein
MKALRRIWIGDNASQMLTAVCNKQTAQYLSLRKKVVDQILEFDEELKVTPLVFPVPIIKRCDWCDGMTLNVTRMPTRQEMR